MCKSLEKTNGIIEALTQFAQDRDTLKQMLHTSKKRMYELKGEILLPKKKFSKKERAQAYRIYAANLDEHKKIVGLLIQASVAHQEIFTAARAKKHPTYLQRIFNFFSAIIMDLRKKRTLFEMWFKDASAILLGIKENTANLQKLALA
jgi:hypothetical protein